ncbi:MFS transporter [Yinghuangia seranimata]|uniref:MFS transporter n=1 Tax=Yinghuangia seranimata TaxID=408067 RepID=UPI00248D3A0F|nr:MFS transporter [Yinghuangia seranimata]MDI2130535.1 MFS transporter [Yinghuangia seranimata]
MTATRRRWRTAIEPLAYLQFRLWATARWTSATGSSVGNLALAFAALQVGGSTADLGVVLAAGMVTETVLPLVGGVLGDRHPRGRVQTCAYLALALLQSVCAVLLLAGAMKVAYLVAASVLTGAVFALAGPAGAGVVPLTVPEHLRGRAVALESTGLNAAKVAGPALAGVLIAAAGPGWAIAVDAASFFAAAALTARLRIAVPVRAEATSRAAFRAGWQAFAGNRAMVVLTLSGMVAVPLWLAGFHVLGPAYGKQVLGGAAPWGLVFAAFTLGLALGAGVFLVVNPRRPGWASCLSALAMATPLAAMAADAPPVVLAAVAFGTGVAINAAIVTWRTWLQHAYPPGMLARITSISGTGQRLLVPAAYLAAGPAAAHMGLNFTLAAAAALLFAAALLPLVDPAVRALRIQPVLADTNPADAAASAAPTATVGKTPLVLGPEGDRT